MKILKLLNKIYFSIILILSFISNICAEDKPVDIWNIDKKKIDSDQTNIESNEIDDENSKNISSSDIFKMQSQKEINSIELDNKINSDQIKIFGLYDPEDNSLDLNMWM